MAAGHSVQPLDCLLFDGAPALKKEDINRKALRYQPEIEPMLTYAQAVDIGLSFDFFNITLTWIGLEFIKPDEDFFPELRIEALYSCGGCPCDFSDGPLLFPERSF